MKNGKNRRTMLYIPGNNPAMIQQGGIYGADSFSSFSNISKIKIPVVVQQSINDESVPYEWGQQLVEKFKQVGKIVPFYSYPNDNHDIANHWYQALDTDVELFRKY